MTLFDLFLFILWMRIVGGVAAGEQFLVDTYYLWRLGVIALWEKVRRA